MNSKFYFYVQMNSVLVSHTVESFVALEIWALEIGAVETSKPVVLLKKAALLNQSSAGAT